MEAVIIILLVVAVVGYLVYKANQEAEKKPVTKADLRSLAADLRSHSHDGGDAESAVQQLRHNVAAMHARLNAIESRELAVRARLDAVEYRLDDTD
jgi:hypothetical protein